MGILLIKCPKTGKNFAAGIEADSVAFESLPQVLTRTRCPHCGTVHLWWTSEAFLADIIPRSD